MSDGAVVVLFALVGACIGSFLNVVIWRLPRGESLSRPSSRCPRCLAPIRWFDNVPVLSWLTLRARCRRCRAGISVRYPLVETLTAGLWLLAALRHDVPRNLAPALAHSLLLSALVAVSFIDWDHRTIPDAITKPGIAIGLALSLAFPGLHPAPIVTVGKPGLASLLDGVAGAATGAGVLLAVRWIGSRVLRKEAMGLGDVKLLAMIGAFTSPVPVLYALLVASVAGAVLGGVHVAVRAATFAVLDGTLASRDAPPGAGTAPLAFSRARVKGDRFVARVVGAGAPAPGSAARVRVTLPADAIWEERDATVVLSGTVESARARGASCDVAVRLDEPPEADGDRLRAFEASRLHVPFGPFLAIGGAAMLLYGDAVVRLATEWPRWVLGGPA